MISPCPPYYSSALSCLLRSHHVLLFRLVASDCLSCSGELVALSSLLLSLSLSPCRSHPVFIFCLAILLAFCLLFSAMRQLLSDIEKLGCGCHTRAPKPISVSCVCRGAEARTIFFPQTCSDFFPGCHRTPSVTMEGGNRIRQEEEIVRYFLPRPTTVQDPRSSRSV